MAAVVLVGESEDSRRDGCSEKGSDVCWIRVDGKGIARCRECRRDAVWSIGWRLSVCEERDEERTSQPAISFVVDN